MPPMDDWLRLDPTGRYALARTRMSELHAQAETERHAPPPRTPAPPGVRPRLGRWLVRVGTALARESEDALRRPRLSR